MRLFHTHDAIQAGAIRLELLETIAVAMMIGGVVWFCAQRTQTRE